MPVTPDMGSHITVEKAKKEGWWTLKLIALHKPVCGHEHQLNNPLELLHPNKLLPFYN